MFSDDDQAVCCGEGNFIVNLAGMKAAPTPLALHPSSLLFSLSFFYLYICLSTTSQSKEHLVPLGPAVTTLTECHIKALSIQPTEKRGEQRGRKKKRENLGQILFHTHTANLSLLMEKIKCSSHQWCCVENPSIFATVSLIQIV